MDTHTHEIHFGATIAIDMTDNPPMVSVDWSDIPGNKKLEDVQKMREFALTLITLSLIWAQEQQTPVSDRAYSVTFTAQVTQTGANVQLTANTPLLYGCTPADIAHVLGKIVDPDVWRNIQPLYH
jgi:hypothetical protein